MGGSAMCSLPFALGMVFGTFTPICSKAMYQVSAVGIDGEERLFVKPWFKCTWMFTAMSFALVLHGLRKACRPGGYSQVGEKTTTWNTIMLIGVPSMFDFIATALSGIGLVWTSVATYQMLRGSLVVWGALLSVAFLGKRLKAHSWWGVFICFVATCIVGVAGVAGTASAAEASGGGVSLWLQVLGVVLVLGAQVVQASQFVAEEKILKGHDLNCEPLVLVGSEGMWGFVISMVVVNPILYYLPGSDVGDRYENFLDSVVKVEHSTLLLCVLLAYWVSVLGYNVCAISVTQAHSAIVHTMLDGMRTLSVWGFDLLLYYVITDGAFGEAWTAYSYLQLFGFALMIYGTLAYDGAVQLPWLSYDLEVASPKERADAGEFLTSPALLQSPILSPRPAQAPRDRGDGYGTSSASAAARPRSGSASISI